MVIKSLILKPSIITLRHLFKKPVTEQYPEERPIISSRFRGMHVNNLSKCIGCSSCARACPNKCIDMTVGGFKEVIKGDNRIKKEIKRPAVFSGRCMFCGLCVEACPTNSLTMSENFELADVNREDLFHSWDSIGVNKPANQSD